MRESVQSSLSHIQAGWDVLLIARRSARAAAYGEIDDSVTDLLRRSRLWQAPTHPHMTAAHQVSNQVNGKKTGTE
jgi:hypothetical protein